MNGQYKEVRYLPGFGAPVHSIDLGEVAAQRSLCTESDASNGIDVGC